MKNSKRTVQWWAKGGGIARCGPFATQEEAADHMRLIPVPGSNAIFPPDVFVWPETVTT